MGFNIISAAEAAVEAKSHEIAYKLTDHYEDHLVQSNMYELCKSYIILGARMMQEELLKSRLTCCQRND